MHIVQPIVTHDANRSLYWDSYQLCIHLQIGAGMCTVLTANAV